MKTQVYSYIRYYLAHFFLA